MCNGLCVFVGHHNTSVVGFLCLHAYLFPCPPVTGGKSSISHPIRSDDFHHVHLLWSSAGPLAAGDSLCPDHCLVGGLTIVTSILVMCCSLCRKLVILAPLTFSPRTVLTTNLWQCLVEVRASGLTCGK